MDVFQDILGENEFQCFQPSDYRALQGVLNDVLCADLKRYIENPDANPRVVDFIKSFLGTTIESMTFHHVLRDKGIIDLIAKLSPEAVLGADVNREDVLEKLGFLYANTDKCITTIPRRDSDAWNTFKTAMFNVYRRMNMEGVETTYSNMEERLMANKFVFYVPNEKGHSTQIGIVSSKRRQWVTCYRGLQYVKYCDEHGIDYVNRRTF